MAISSNPYLNFPNNDCREAMTFYGTVLGAEPQIMPMTGMPDVPDNPELVMHAVLTVDGVTIMGADNCAREELTRGNCFTIALMSDDETRAREVFAGLSEGGTVTMPMEKQPWGDVYGQFTDRYGVQWAVNCSTRQ